MVFCCCSSVIYCCVFLLCLCVMCVTCLLYCYTTATGLKPNCSLTNIYIYINTCERIVACCNEICIIR
jgi:hypothetical protein